MDQRVQLSSVLQLIYKWTDLVNNTFIDKNAWKLFHCEINLSSNYSIIAIEKTHNLLVRQTLTQKRGLIKGNLL